jgi:hypothetical protein
MSTAFIPTGPSTLITGNTTAVQGNIVTSGAYSTQYLRIDNTSNANIDAVVNFGTANTTTATIANATSTGNGFIVQHGDSVIVSTTGGFNQEPTNRLYISVVTASSTANLYITPVALVS